MAALTYTARASKWAAKVVSGKTPAGELQKQQCANFLKDLKRAGKKGCPFWFNQDAAEKSCAFIELLPYPAGEWETEHIKLIDWQIFVLVNIDGFRWIEGKSPAPNDPRRFNEVYLEVGRGNGKTAFVAAFTVKEMCLTATKGGQIFSAATTGVQARGVVDDAREILRGSPELCEMLEIEVLANSIVRHSNGTKIFYINSKASTQDGKRVACGVLDELHAQPNRKLFDVIYSARGKFPNAINVYITTAGDDTEGVCYDQHQLIVKALKGVIKLERYFGLIFTPDEGDDPFLVSTIRKANPSYDAMPILRTELKTARDKAKVNTAAQGDFKMKRLNQWSGATVSWLMPELVLKCGEPDLELEAARGQTIYLGVDLSDKQDITALCWSWFESISGEPILNSVFRYYAPEEVIAKRVRDGYVFYQEWADNGYLELTPGQIIDHSIVQDYIIETLPEIGAVSALFDQYGGAQLMAASLTNIHNIDAQVLHKNARNYTDPCMELEARVNASTWRHDANPVTNWMFSNATVERRRDKSLLPTKDKGGSRNKIDGVDACIMSMRPLVDMPPTPKPAPNIRILDIN